MRAGRPRTWTASALTGLLAGASLLRAAPPSWVTAFPRGDDSYVGIGRGDKRLNPAHYREAAQEEALAQISREISVLMLSESHLRRSEDADGWRESYRQEVTAASRNDLAGYERADVYETEEELWVLYTLDKATFRGLQSAKAAAFLEFLSREAAAADAALAGRRYQEAEARHAGVRARYLSDYAGDPWLRARFPEPEARYAALAARLAASLRGLVLVSGQAAWVLDWASDAGTADLALADPATGEKGAGPLTVWIAAAGAATGPSCRAETDGLGRLDLSDPALRCGLGPGIWRVSWRGPEGREAALERRVSFRKRDLHVTLGPEGEAPGMLREELALLEAPRWRLVAAAPQDPAAPRLEIRLLEASTDTLGGMHFARLRGRVRFPGGGGEEIVGKSGHSDAARSLRLAARDFARQVAAGLGASEGRGR